MSENKKSEYIEYIFLNTNEKSCQYYI